MDSKPPTKDQDAAMDNPEEAEAENGGQHRASMYELGFSPDIVERAYEELGDGVDREMLMEYLLFMRANEEPAGPSSSRGHGEITISTLHKLTTEFQFPSAVVEKAMNRCNTPLQNATQEDMAILVDFLAAHMEALIEEEAITLPYSDNSHDSDDDLSLGGDGEDFEDGLSCWNVAPNEGKGKGMSSVGGKRKPESSWGKSKTFLGSPSAVKKPRSFWSKRCH